MNLSLEYNDSKSSKFWNISVKGSSHTVTYGRIGTTGQTKTKKFASASLAKADAEKLIVSKKKKGYADAGQAKSKATSSKSNVKKSKPTKSSVNNSSKRPPKTNSANKSKTKPIAKNKSGLVEPVFAFGFADLDLVYQDGPEVLIVRLENDEVEAMKEGISLVEYQKQYQIHLYYDTELRKFRSKGDATKAVARMLADTLENVPREHCVNVFGFDVAINFEKPGVKFKQKFQRLGEVIEVPKKGPIQGQTLGMPHWIYPRPPMVCCCCGNPLVPAFTFLGDIDPLLGKKSAVVVSVCRYTEGSDCGTMAEVVYQRADRKPTSSLYFENAKTKEFLNLHLSEQVDQTEKVHFAVALHRGSKDTPGWVTWENCKSLDAAKTYINKMKRIHVKGKLTESKNPSASPKLSQYQVLYDAMARPDVMGKKLKPSNWFAKRVTEGYETHTVNCSGENPTNYSYFFSRDGTIAGGEPPNRFRHKKISANMKKWSVGPYIFFSFLKGMHPLSDPVASKEYEIWINPDEEFGRSIVVDEN